MLQGYVGVLLEDIMLYQNLTLGIQSYSQLMIGVSNHLLSIVFGFHYHSQKVIGSLGFYFIPSEATSLKFHGN